MVSLTLVYISAGAAVRVWVMLLMVVRVKFWMVTPMILILAIVKVESPKNEPIASTALAAAWTGRWYHKGPDLMLGGIPSRVFGRGGAGISSPVIFGSVDWVVSDGFWRDSWFSSATIAVRIAI